MDQQLKPLIAAGPNLIPPGGWIRPLRMAIRMTQQQLADRMSISRQAARQIEQREQTGALSLATMKAVAQAMDMEFIYGFIPKEGNLEDHLDRQALKAARAQAPSYTDMMVRKLANSMKEKPLPSIWGGRRYWFRR